MQLLAEGKKPGGRLGRTSRASLRRRHQINALRFFRDFLLVLAVCSSLAAADSIHLRNGRHFQGKYIGGTTTVIGFMTSGAVEYFATSDVLALMFDGADSPLNGLQPNHMNGDSGWQGQEAIRNMSVRPRNKSQRSLRFCRSIQSLLYFGIWSVKAMG